MPKELRDDGGSVSLRALEMAAQVRTQGQDVSGRAEQVTLQLESAIGMGLLNPGERLPPESVMAEHLGVSPLTLRQSLAVLRSKGLLGTRRGRGGGSYVAGVLPVREAEIAQQLRRHKSDDLRDLIDLAAATAGSAARLASKRSDEQDVRRLRKLAQRFAASSEPHMLRQADARLHIGLGVAAQPRRLTALLIQIHAELSPLRGARRGRTGTRSREHRHRTLRTGRCPHHQPAPGHPHLGPGGPAVNPINEVLQSTAQALGQSLSSVFADLERLAEATAQILGGPGTSRTKLESLKPSSKTSYSSRAASSTAPASPLPGACSAPLTRGTSGGASSGGKLVFIPHNLNPASINYYDYTEMTWYERPLASGQPELIGPYIDFGGADMKIVTASRPVLHEQRTVAVAGADLSMEFIERTFLLNLGRRDEHVALITETGKVVASNSARVRARHALRGPAKRPLVSFRAGGVPRRSPVAPRRGN